MKFDEFDKLSDELMSEVKKMRDTKGREYAGEKDRFDNFNRLAARTGLSRNQVWLVYFTKHMDAIESYIRNGRTFSDEGIHGRIVDAVTYLTLIDGMIQEDAQRADDLKVVGLEPLPAPSDWPRGETPELGKFFHPPAHIPDEQVVGKEMVGVTPR